MPNRLFLAAIPIALLAVSACSDGPMGNAPVTPPGRTVPLGMITGTVSGKTLTAEFTPMGAAGAMSNAVSPSIYGGTTTIAVTGTFVSLVDNTPPGNRTWTFNVHMQNLLAYAIGSNYSASNPAPPDTSGVFIGFTTLPTVTQSPPCPGGCTVTVTNWAGMQAFTAPGQPFFWYKDRPTAVQGSPSTDTTSDVPWQFVGTFVPLLGDTANTFRFQLMVSAAWPSPNDSVWAYNYSGATDSLPDQFAKPRWKTPFTQLNGFTTLGSETFNLGTDLVLTAATGTSSIYIARHDSMDVLRSAEIAIKGNLQNTIAGVPIQAVFGLVVPGAGGNQAVLGIYEDHVAFVHLDPVTGHWTDIGGIGTSVTMNTTVSHRYGIRKEGSINLYLLCVDNSTVGFITNAQLDAVAPDFSTTTVFYGALGNATGPANFHVANVVYTLGADPGVC